MCARPRCGTIPRTTAACATAAAPGILTQVPGTRSVWATGSAFNANGNFGEILKYGP